MNVFFAFPNFSSFPYAVRICIPPIITKRNARDPVSVISIFVIRGSVVFVNELLFSVLCGITRFVEFSGRIDGFVTLVCCVVLLFGVDGFGFEVCAKVIGIKLSCVNSIIVVASFIMLFFIM